MKPVGDLILKTKVRNIRDGRWFWLHHRVLDQYGRELGPYGIAVYCALCRFASRDQRSFPSQKRIAETIGASRSKACHEIEKLRRLGLIWAAKRDGRRNIYFLLRPWGYPVEKRPTPVSREHQDVSEDDRTCVPGRQ
jgi:hypothetical protein